MNTIKRQLDKYNIILNDSQIEKLYHYYNLVAEYNKSVNLTAITDYEEFILKHYVDSLYLLLLNNKLTNSRILDLGTGGGFPGIPLAIALPDCSFVLMDSLNKRIRFLCDAVSELSLDNVLPLHGRAEEMGHDPEYREAFDFCVSRAVAKLSVLSEFALPLVKVGGSFISYKADDIDLETKSAENAIKTLGGEVNKIEKYIISQVNNEDDMHRSMVFIDKTSSTPDKYPRRAGVPSKKPL